MIDKVRLGDRDYPVRSVLTDPPAVGGFYGLDVETTYMGPLGQWSPDFEVRLVQVADDESVWLFDPADPDQLSVLRELASGSQFVSHTPMDVISLWVAFGIDIIWRNVDTRMLSRMVDASRGTDHDLKTLTSRHIGPELASWEKRLHDLFVELYPGKRNAARALVDAHGWRNVVLDDPVYLTYAALDAVAVRRLAPILIELTQAPRPLIETEIWLARQAVAIQIRGMRVDQAALNDFEIEAVSATERPRELIKKITGLPAQSPKLAAWLIEHGATFGEDHPRTERGAYQMTRESVLSIVPGPSPEAVQVVDAIGAFKGHQDALTRAKGVREHLCPDGMVRPVLHSIGAVTARMSSAGPNFQNFSKSNPGARGLFIPQEGHTLITADFDQVELRVVAALAKESKMIDVILAGGDLHQLTVDELRSAGIVVSRDVGKMTNFLIVYGGGGRALSEQARIPLAEAQAIVRAHRERYPAIQALTDRLGRSTKAIRTISGRRIPVKWRDGQPASYANINYLVQSSARDLLVHGWLRLLHGASPDLAGKIWFPIHDELVLEVPSERLTEAMAAVEAAMTFDFLGVPISAGAVPLIDANGVSRWMTSKYAEKCASMRGFLAEVTGP